MENLCIANICMCEHFWQDREIEHNGLALHRVNEILENNAAVEHSTILLLLQCVQPRNICSLTFYRVP